jgi:hypothetical protein
MESSLTGSQNGSDTHRYPSPRTFKRHRSPDRSMSPDRGARIMSYRSSTYYSDHKRADENHSSSSFNNKPDSPPADDLPIQSNKDTTSIEEVLPLGWEKRVQEDGSFLYYNILSKMSQQEPPQGTASLLEGSAMGGLSAIISRALAAHKIKESNLSESQKTPMTEEATKAFRSQVSGNNVEEGGMGRNDGHCLSIFLFPSRFLLACSLGFSATYLRIDDRLRKLL